MENSNEKKSLYLKIIKIVAMIGIILIPTIYTTVFLGSMWDPYGKLDKLPVAVVNLDKEVSYNNKSLAVGNELVNNLKENKSLNFNFVDEEEAQEGLDKGSYYMVITIPENFSSNATTLLEENPKKMELNYKTNPGKNYIASKMSESAIKQIASAIENSVTETYAKSVFDQFSSIGESLNTASDGASQIRDGLTSLEEGSNKISSNLNLLYNSSLTFTDGITTYENGISKYIAGVEKITSGANTLNNGMNTLNSKVSSLSNGATALNSGSQSLYNGLQSYTDGVNSLKGGSKDLLNGLNSMSSALSASINEENSKNIKTLTGSLTSLNKGISDFNTAMQSSETKSDLTNAFTNLGGNLQSIGGSLKNSSVAVSNLNTKIQEIKSSSWFTALDAQTQNSILSDLGSVAQSLNTELTNINTQVSSASGNLGTAVNEATNISNQVNLTKNTLNTIAGNSNILLTKSSETINNLYSGLENVKTNLDEKIIPGFETLTNGVDTLNSKSSLILGGAKELSNGITTLSSSVPALTSGISELNSGTNSLSQGLNELSANNSTLVSGISTINNASKSISDGVSKLYDGSLQLSDGTTKLVDGSGTLADKLKDGSKSASSTKLSDSSREMFASPVNTSGEYNSNIENNGSAMSAYMMSVGLWVGSLALCILFSTDKDIARGRGNLKSYWTKKALKLAGLATAQAVIMLTAIIKLNGLNPAYVGKTYLVAIVTGLSFMAIVYFMNLLLGKVGSFILLVFMMLQLSGSAGTYPIELSGKFFNSIHKYVPFTYSVDGFRNGLSTGQSVTKELMVLGIIGLVCAIISIFVVIKKSASTRVSLTELIEEAM